MLVEYRHKVHSQSDCWVAFKPSYSHHELPDEAYSYRINKNRQYHHKDAPGFKEAFNKIQAWRRLSE